MRDDDYCGGWGGGATCTKERACAILVPTAKVVSSSLRSPSDLTYLWNVCPVEGLLLCDGNCVNVVHRKVFWLRDPWHVRLVVPFEILIRVYRLKFSAGIIRSVAGPRRRPLTAKMRSKFLAAALLGHTLQSVPSILRILPLQVEVRS